MKKFFKRINGQKSETWYCTERASFKTLKEAMVCYDRQVIEKPKAKVSISIQRDSVWVETYERKRGAH